jgi:hypothetical protein
MNLNSLKSSIQYSLVILVLVGFGFMFTYKVSAQTTGDVSVRIVPENPAPGESVTINLNSYYMDLNALKITWLIGGKSVLSGIGEKSYSLTAPAAGSEITVTIQVASGGAGLETKVVIHPSVMVVLWQADDSYVPPFYKGKAMPTPDSAIKIVAMPEIKTSSGYINPKNMTYSWRQDYTNDQQASGYGKNYFAYTSDYLDASNYIEVSAMTIDQKYSSVADVTVGTFSPKLVFYKTDENLGTLFENALSNGHNIVNKEIIFAAPYFISPKDIRIPRLVWTWSINDQAVENTGFQKNVLPLQVESGVSGTSKIKLEIENKDKIFETASSELNVEF